MAEATENEPLSFDPLFIGNTNSLSKGREPKQFKDNDGTTIPVWVELDCNGKRWQASLSEKKEIFTLAPFFIDTLLLNELPDTRRPAPTMLASSGYLWL